MDSRLYPIQPEIFAEAIEPRISKHYKRPGRPAGISHYQFFCAVLYVLRTGIPWRDLPPCYGAWHTVYTRFKRWSENGLFWELLYSLQQEKKLIVKIVWVDSSSVPLHRHGGGSLQKRGPKQKVEEEKD